MPSLFISYRREDSAGFAGRIYDRLQSHFGRESVFMDVDSIPLGVDFRDHLGEAVSRCDALLVIIADRWAAAPGDGHSRLDEPDDFVRIEIETALARDIPVVPVLVGGAAMPSEEELPPSLRPLAYRNACTVDTGPDFHTHVDRLIRGLQNFGSGTSTLEVSGATAVQPRTAQNDSLTATAGEVPSVVEVVSGAAQGSTYALTKDRVLIGRSRDCDISLTVPAMSRYHAQFVRLEDGYWFEDLGARNGSHVNGVSIQERTRLHDGDRIHTGAVILIFRREPRTDT